jgi:hypothetical protein
MDVMGVRPFFGRLLAVADENPASPRTIVLVSGCGNACLATIARRLERR